MENIMIKIRKLLTVTEEIVADGGRAAKRPVRKVAAVAIIEDPFAGTFVDDLTPLIDTGEELGALLAKRLTEALGGAAESYGNAAIVGEASAKKLGGPGTAIDVPLHFKDAAFVRTHYDVMEIRVAEKENGLR
jgi:Amino acid synthesis